MSICIHCQEEFTPKHRQGKRKCCDKPKCILAEKERRKAMNKEWYLREQAKGRFKQKENDNKKIKPETAQKKCLRCKKMYEGIVGKGDSKWGICPHCKRLQAYHYSEDDMPINILGAI